MSRAHVPVRRLSPVASVALSLALLGLVACSSTTSRAGQGSATTTGGGRPAVAAFLGDSYTTGYGASDLAHRWSSLVAAHFGWIEKNLGIGGTGYAAAAPPYLARVPAVAAVNPSVVVVSGGFNDLLQGVTDVQFQQAAAATFVALRSAVPHARIIGLRPFYPAAPPPARAAVFAEYVRQAVGATGGTYLDIGSPLTGQTADVGPDQLHPNDAGYQVLALAVESALASHH